MEKENLRYSDEKDKEEMYVYYPIRVTKKVPTTYAASKDVFWSKHRQYDREDMPFVAEFSYKKITDKDCDGEEIHNHDIYDPYFKRVQQSFKKVTSSWRNDDFYENVKLRDELGNYIDSTKVILMYQLLNLRNPLTYENKDRFSYDK